MPVLVPTDVAAMFIVRVKGQQGTEEEIKSARNRVYYLAREGVLTKHGLPKRGRALWDLQELAAAYRHAVDVVLR